MSDTLLDQMQTYYRATHVPVSIFQGMELIHTVTTGVNTFNLSLILRNGLNDPLPPSWLCSLPEDMVLAGTTALDGRIVVLGPLLPYDCYPSRASAILEFIHHTRTMKDIQEMINYFNIHAHANEDTFPEQLQLLHLLPGFDHTAEGFCFSHVSFTLPQFIATAPMRHSEPAYLSHTLPDPYTATTNSDFERKLFSVMAEGRTDEMRQMLARSGIQDGTVQYSYSTIHRYYLVGSLTVASRVATGAGVPYAICEAQYNRAISELQSVHDGVESQRFFVSKMILFTQLVHVHAVSDTGDRLVRNVYDYVECHLREPVTLEQTAAASGYSSAYLSRRFHTVTGSTFMQYVHERKIQEAVRLLNVTDDSISAISGYLGFESKNYFARLFRKYTGMTPTQMRQKSSCERYKSSDLNRAQNAGDNGPSASFHS